MAQEVNIQEDSIPDVLNMLVIGVCGLIILFTIVLYTRSRLIRKHESTMELQQELLISANTEISQLHETIRDKNRDIAESVHYAERIQQAIMPSTEYCEYHLSNYFILFKPKQIVSGDFYWLYATPDSKVIWMVADCTGHGVPGAFMSMIGNSLLNEIVIQKRVTRPGEILDLLRTGIVNALNEGGENNTKDGMDGVICMWDKKQNTLDFAGAFNSLYLYRKGVHNKAADDDTMSYHGDDLVEFKTDYQPISIFEGQEFSFNTHEIQLKKGDRIYICSDGWQQQLGGPENKEYGNKRVLECLDSIQDSNIKDQGQPINTAIEQWKGEQEQVDDICIIGVAV